MRKHPATKENDHKVESSLGFPVGKVAKSLRGIIHRGLSDHDVECITVVLVSHMMIEDRMNNLIYKWMTKCLPKISCETKDGKSVNEVAEELILSCISKLEFTKKVDFIKPLGVLLWTDDAEGIFKDIYKINNVRVEVVHRLDVIKIKFKGKSINTEDGLEAFFELAQQRLTNISDLIELVEQ